MVNREIKNWNNFYLGLAVVVVALIGIPLIFKQLALVVLGLLIALFSLARPGRLATPSSADQPLTHVE